MHPTVAIHFFRKATKLFSFLETEHGFSVPACVLHRDTAHVSYFGKNLAICISFTEPLHEVICEVFWIEDIRQEAPYFNEDSRYPSMTIGDLAAATVGRAGVQMGKRTYLQEITAQLEANSSLLKTCPDILADKLHVIA